MSGEACRIAVRWSPYWHASTGCLTRTKRGLLRLRTLTAATVHIKFDVNATGKKVLSGQLLNQSGQVVDIPHVIATFYDNNGKVIWVADGYVDHALFPLTPEPFSVELPAHMSHQCATNHLWALALDGFAHSILEHTAAPISRS